MRAYYYVLASVLAAAGLVMALVGHRLFNLEMAVSGALACLLLSYIFLYLMGASYIGKLSHVLVDHEHFLHGSSIALTE